MLTRASATLASLLLLAGTAGGQGISPAIERLDWPNTVAENWIGGNPSVRSADGWEMAIHFTGLGDRHVGGLDVYVAEADSSRNVIGDIWVTTTTDYNPFQTLQGPPTIGVIDQGFVLQSTPSYPRCPTLSGPASDPGSRCISDTYFDITAVHDCNWYVSFEGSAPLYYAPELAEDTGYLIWVDKPAGAQANYKNAIYVFLDTDHEPNDWDSFVRMRYSHEGFSSWYKLSNSSGHEDEGITIDSIANFVPPINPLGIYYRSPADHAVEAPGTVYFSWHEASSAQDFELLVNGVLYSTRMPWHYVSLSPGTYTWKVRSILHNVASDWTSPRTLTIQSLAGTVSGPSSVTLPDRFDPPITRTWTASASGGSGGYTYTWYKVVGSSRYYLKTGSSYSQSFNYGGSTSTLRLEVDVRDSSNTEVTKSKTVHIFPGEGGGGAGA